MHRHPSDRGRGDAPDLLDRIKAARTDDEPEVEVRPDGRDLTDDQRARIAAITRVARERGPEVADALDAAESQARAERQAHGGRPPGGGLHPGERRVMDLLTGGAP